MRLHEILTRAAERHADRTALIYEEQTWTYAELTEQVNRLAAALHRRGIRAGDRIALLTPNHPSFTLVYFAVTALGGVCVPANPLLKAAELTYLWGDSEIAAAFVAAPLLSTAQTVIAALPHELPLFVLGESNLLPTLDGLLAEAGDTTLPEPVFAEDAPAVCIYTSGTTGRPKGALLSHENLTVNCEQIIAMLHFDERENFLCVLPLFHAFAATVCQNTALTCGATITLLDGFHPARVLEAIAEQRVTIFPGIPAMFGAMLQFGASKPEILSSVRLCVSGGAPMPLALLDAFERTFDTILIEGDGPTECSPVTSVNPPEGVRKPGSVGLPLPGVEIQIWDDADRPVPTDTVGEIVVRGQNVMRGYHNLPEATAEAMRGGWYHTGDLGRIDSDGYVYIVDRKKDMLIVGGLNVYPREVEEILYAHPSVQEVAVIGLPDALRGEEVVAVVVPQPNSTLTARDLIAFCRERLANYKVPRRVLFRETLPKGGTGKVVKRLLRKELEMGEEAERAYGE